MCVWLDMVKKTRLWASASVCSPTIIGGRSMWANESVRRGEVFYLFGEETDGLSGLAACLRCSCVGGCEEGAVELCLSD